MVVKPRLVPLAALVAVLISCRQAPAQPAAVIAWYDCVECSSDQLAAVKALGDQAVPEFRSTLLNGPSDDRLKAEQRRLKEAYEALKDYERRHPENKVERTEQQYIDVYQRQFVLRNRLRSVSALVAIATPNARQALAEAQKMTNLPDALRKAIDNALVLRNRIGPAR